MALITEQTLVTAVPSVIDLFAAQRERLGKMEKLSSLLDKGNEMHDDNEADEAT